MQMFHSADFCHTGNHVVGYDYTAPMVIFAVFGLCAIIFLTLLFVVNSSKVIFLVMWIASLFIISGYLIAIEYKDYNMTENLKDIVGNEYDDSLIDTAKAISDITKNYIKNGGSEE